MSSAASFLVKDPKLYICSINGIGGEASKYDNVDDFSEGLAPVRIGSTWHYINTKGEPVLTFHIKEEK